MGDQRIRDGDSRDRQRCRIDERNDGHEVADLVLNDDVESEVGAHRLIESVDESNPFVETM